MDQLTGRTNNASNYQAALAEAVPDSRRQPKSPSLRLYCNPPSPCASFIQKKPLRGSAAGTRAECSQGQYGPLGAM